MAVKSPYNFVPISDKVYFPRWADQVSHDMPFSDQRSGELTVHFISESPIYVKNGGDSNGVFSKIKNEYFIPGTSIKGAIRSVLEIISFSKMKPVDNRKYSWRELQNQDYSSRFTKNFNTEPKVRAGFIRDDGNNWYLIPAKMARIEQCELDEYFGTHEGILSAKEKYNFWIKKNKKLENFFNISGPGTNVFLKQCGKFRRAKFSSNGGVKGTLVFTGQIQPRKKGGEGKHGKNRKHLEFVFYDLDEKNKMLIDSEMRRNFELNHSKERNIDNHKLAMAPNEEWEFWKPKLSKGQLMPVFWLQNKNGTVESFGLSMLYRLPYKNSIHDLLPLEHKSMRPDLAELIFGTIDGTFNLKGRVQFGIGKIIGNQRVLGEKRVILSSPKATFYPNYIRQDSTQSYKTYDHNDSILAGRKRYPIHKNATPINNFNPSMQNLSTKITPLDKGTMFKVKIRYHNLKPIELGALLSALTFHGYHDKLFHSLGMGKSLGYGKVKLTAIESTEDEKNIINYMQLFEKEMDAFLGGKGRWRDSEQIKELFLMSAESNIDELLVYMSLEEYLNIKKYNKESLKKYSEMSGTSFELKKDFNSKAIINLLRKPIIRKNLSFTEYEKIKDMSLKQFKKYIKHKAKIKEFEPAILDILKLKDSPLADYLNRQLSKKSGEIYNYIETLKKKIP